MWNRQVSIVVQHIYDQCLENIKHKCISNSEEQSVLQFITSNDMINSITNALLEFTIQQVFSDEL